MYVQHLSLTDYRSYPQIDVDLGPGVTILLGPNGVGKTNIVEAIGYLASLSSHRVSSDKPLIGFGADRALVRGRLVRGSQTTSVELEINAERTNRARINRANPVRARNAAGILRTVLFAPEDLVLVKGDPAGRRRFLDDLMVVLVPHHAAVRTDYERVLKQRNALLKSARTSGRLTSSHEATLDVWDQHLAEAGSRLLHGRLNILNQLQPHLQTAYRQLTDGSKDAVAVYRSTLSGVLIDDDGGFAGEGGEDLHGLGIEELMDRFTAALVQHRKKEVERGISLVGPHRDEVELLLGSVPAKGYASHGETWSMALSLRLGTYYLLNQDDQTPGATPVLILDDVFAELDLGRRERLAGIVAGAEQVLVTAAVSEDVPSALIGRQLRVSPGGVDEYGS